MSVSTIFGVSMMMSFVACGIVVNLYIFPQIRDLPRERALLALIAPHAFRFFSLCFLVPGVVSPSLEAAFAEPAAYGEFCASILAIIAIFALNARVQLAIPMVWLFNIWGFADLYFAIHQGAIGVGIMPGSLGAAYFIPIAIMPPTSDHARADLLAAASRPPTGPLVTGKQIHAYSEQVLRHVPALRSIPSAVQAVRISAMNESISSRNCRAYNSITSAADITFVAAAPAPAPGGRRRPDCHRHGKVTAALV